ncbi:MAG TPA: condensation domain-containing protein, partial [Ktedonobacteraceae bacterium]|nr:condensation domain-containing protein [Ktedonobacteraceae bacterium]
AYVLYTSGSTGQPKGVLVEHRALLNYLLAIQQHLALSPAGVCAMLQPLTVDSCLTMLFPPLLSGSPLLLIPRERAIDAHALATRLREYPADALKIAPSHLAALLSGAAAQDVLPRQRLIIGGEASSWSWVQHLRSLLPAQARLYNHYGPTEATVGVLTCLVEPTSSAPTSDLTPLGKPLANIQAYILDAHLQPVPVGVLGDLYLAGAGLARGYLGRPDLTAEQFVPHPFSPQAGQRLYRTGDLARWLPGGVIEFGGRRDEQVKIRGYRIELGEIEAALVEHQGVREALVVAREDGTGDKRLVAYVVAEQGQACEREELRRFVGERLPVFMLPAAFVFLERFPLSTHGKVDRKSLPAPAWESVLLEDEAEPVTWNEKILAGIWAEVLGAERVGIHTNFFQAGGDSILTLLIIARARRQGLILTPRQVFQHQTIAELAAAVEGDTAAMSDEKQEQDSLPLLPWQAWFFEQQFPDPHDTKQVACLEIPDQHLNLEILRGAVAHLLERHAALRLRFTPGPQGWEQHIAPEEIQATSLVEILDVKARAADAQAEAIAKATAQLQAGLNLETGPVLRVLLVERDASQSQLLLLVAHPLVVDSVSWHILLTDLEKICNQLEQGITPPLSSEIAALKRWGARLHSLANSSELVQEASYWLDLASQDIPALPLDFEVEPQANGEVSVNCIRCSLEAEETRALLQDVPTVYHTQTEDLLLTALLLACAPWSGHHKLLVNLVGSGRTKLFDDIDISNTAGCFTNVYPVLLDLERQATSPLARVNSGQAIKTIKEQLHSVPRQGHGYSVLRSLQKADHPLRAQLEALPQPHVSFNYLGEFADAGWHWLPPTNPDSLHGGQGKNARLLAVSGLIARGQLHMYWQYNALAYRTSTIEALAERYLERLKALIAHCRTLDTGSYTPSDFPELGLSQAMLDKVLGKLRPPRRGAQS